MQSHYCLLPDTIAIGNAQFGYGSGTIWLDNVNCSGSESTLLSCPHYGIGQHNCGHYEDAGVRCSGMLYYKYFQNEK